MAGEGKWIPSPKVATGTALGTPLGIIVAWTLGLWGHAPPPEVAIALGSLVTGLVSYIVPNPPAVVVGAGGEMAVTEVKTGADVTTVSE